MQSSPPIQALERPSSPAESIYSLDLGVLDGEDFSDHYSSVPQPPKDHVLSENIEGPSDFTLNLEKWMKGGTFGKSTAKIAKHGSASLHGQDNDSRCDALVPAVEHPAEKMREDGTTDSRHTPNDTPPRTASLWSISKPIGEQLAEELEQAEPASSEWEPYSHESTPQPQQKAQSHQPTAEDYYSEMDPAIRPSVSRYSSTSAKNGSPTVARRSASVHSEPSTVGRIPSRPISPAPSLTAKRRLSPRSDERLEAQFRLMQERYYELENASVALNLALEKERRSRRQEEAEYKDRIAEAFQHQQELTKANKAIVEASAQIEQWRIKSEDGEDKAKVLSKRVQQQEERILALQDEHVIEVQELHQRLEKQRTDHEEHLHRLRNKDDNQLMDIQDPSKEIACLRNELSEMRNKHNAELPSLHAGRNMKHRNHEADETADEKAQKSSRSGDSDGADLDRMQLELRRAHDVGAELDELRGRMHIVTGEKQQMKFEIEAAQQRVASLEAELKRMSLAKNSESARTAGELQRSRVLVDSLEQQKKELQQQLHDQRATYETEAELKRLGEPEIDPEIALLRNDITVKQTALNTALLERDALQDRLKSVNTELANLESTNAGLHIELTDSRAAFDNAKLALDEAEVVNAAFDAKISSAICKREKYWRERLEKSTEERKLMVKQLMHLWGQQEVGAARPQEFEYKFVRAGKDKAGMVAFSKHDS
nr:hypothetical protein CFP56_29869 [Quercus suber]